MRKRAAFTLIEVVISVFIMMLLLMLAVPSISGVMADRRLRRSLDNFNHFVYQAQQRSLSDHRPYLLVWHDKDIELRPEIVRKGEGAQAVAHMEITKGDSFALKLTAALRPDPPPAWVFWPTGTCEPAVVKFVGRDGTWTASYSALTARADLIAYAAR